MARTTKTTRQVDHEVVDALQAAQVAGAQAAEAWDRAQRRVIEVTLLTAAHDDLVEDAEKTSGRMSETRHLIAQRLRIEQEGKN
jgi:two-component sensor histidine kinase